MNARVDLVLLQAQSEEARWDLGKVSHCAPTPKGLNECINGLIAGSTAEAVLFWDPGLALPSPETILGVLARPGELWHGGLHLGQQGLPRLLRKVAPTWMLSCDPDPEIEATSWRLSWQACLVKTQVLRQMGAPLSQFQTLAGSGLEYGHRCITRGVITRHIPWLLTRLRGTLRAADAPSPIVQPATALAPSPLGATRSLPLEDELRFIYQRCGTKWARWACLRGALDRSVNLSEANQVYRLVLSEPKSPAPAPLVRPPITTPAESDAKVSVLIPTIDRYPYLTVLLGQLREQTIAPHEIIVIDQTRPEARNTQLAQQFSDLPLQLLYQDQPGQCTSRNAGLQRCKGDYVLFIDDDDEVPPTLIEDHLRSLEHFRAEVSSGVAEEVGAGPLPEQFKFLRASDVFPTNNTLVRKSVLERSGLFDLAYNRGQRADGDLGMRVYLSGAVMVLNPAISVLHHHAPAGGLRVHGARVVTYASSRTRLTHRQIVSATELYLAARYFSAEARRETAWLSTLGTFSYRGNRLKRLMKLFIGLGCLPHTLGEIRRRNAITDEMLQQFPQIPKLARREQEVGERLAHQTV